MTPVEGNLQAHKVYFNDPVSQGLKPEVDPLIENTMRLLEIKKAGLSRPAESKCIY